MNMCTTSYLAWIYLFIVHGYEYPYKVDPPPSPSPLQGVDGCEGNRLCFPKMSCDLIDGEIIKQY